MTRFEWRGAAVGEDAAVAARHRADGPHQEGHVVAHGEVAEDVALHADGCVDEQGCTSGAEPPVDRGELVHQVPSLLAEQARQVHLFLAEQVEPHPRRALGDAQRVVGLRDAYEEVRRVDAALGGEAGQAAAHLAAR